MRFDRLSGVLLVGAMLMVTACSSNGGSSGGSSGETAVGCPTTDGAAEGAFDPEAVLRYGSVPASSLDPIRGVEANEIIVLRTIFEPLVKLDAATGAPAPGLATSWEMVDKDTMELVLREGVTFSDGTAFDADAVKFNLERAKTSPDSTIAGTLEAVQDIQVVDTATVRLTLDPVIPAALPITLSDRAGLMASPAAVKAAGSSDAFSAAPVGTGPYALEGEWFSRELVEVRAWDGYWDAENRKLGGIDFVETSTDASVGALKAGDLDVQYVDDAQVDAVCDDDDLRVAVSATNEPRILIVNQAMAPFDDELVREALSYALDREAIADVMTGGTAEVATQWFPEGSVAYSAEVADQYSYDPERAKELLAEAGYPDGVSFKAEVGGTFTSYVRMGEVIQAQLKDSGFEMELELIDAAQALSRVFGIGGTEPAVAASPLAAPPTDQPSQRFRDRFYADGTYNPSRVEVPGVRDLVSKADETTDPDERSQLLQEASQLAVDATASGVPLYFVPGNTAFAPYVGGITTGATRSNISFEGLYITPDREPVGTKSQP